MHLSLICRKLAFLCYFVDKNLLTQSNMATRIGRNNEHLGGDISPHLLVNNFESSGMQKF